MPWLGTWAKRRQLTVAASDVDANLTDFPVLVRLSTTAGKTSVDVTDIFDDLGTNKLKIAFTESNGTSQLYAEIVYWDATGEATEIWVKVPSLLAASGGNIYMYFDPVQADNTTYIGDGPTATATGNVWDSNFLRVHHFNETTGGYLDSTSNNGHTGTPTITSRTANGFFNNNTPNFDGVDDNMKAVSPGSFPVDKTLEAFMLTDSVSGGYNGIVNHNTGTNWFQLGRNNASAHFRWHSSDTNRRFDFGTLSTGTWHHVVGALKQTGAEAKGLIDGSPQTSVTPAGIPATTATSWLIGQGNSASESWDGRLDEFRYSTVSRSNAWVAATNDTLRDNFTTWGTTETGGGYANPVNGVTNLGAVNTVVAANIGSVNTV